MKIYGEGIVQTTTLKRPWQHGVVRKSVGFTIVQVRLLLSAPQGQSYCNAHDGQKPIKIYLKVCKWCYKQNECSVIYFTNTQTTNSIHDTAIEMQHLKQQVD